MIFQAVILSVSTTFAAMCGGGAVCIAPPSTAPGGVRHICTEVRPDSFYVPRTDGNGGAWWRLGDGYYAWSEEEDSQLYRYYPQV